MNRLEHLMTILNEECAEVAQATSKALRFGLNEGRDIACNNVERMREEINDLVAMVEMLQAEGVDLSPDYARRAQKKAKVEQYLIYSIECGTLDAPDDKARAAEAFRAEAIEAYWGPLADRGNLSSSQIAEALANYRGRG